MRIDNDYRGWFPHETLTGEVISAFFYVYNRLQYGFLESVYAAALARTLSRRGHQVAREVKIPVIFDGETIGYHRADLIVDGKVIVEVKTSARLHDSAVAQLLSYLRATNLEIGLVLHFGLEATHKRVASRNDSILIESKSPKP